MLPGLVELSVPIVLGFLLKEDPHLTKYKVWEQWTESVEVLAAVIEKETRVALLVSPKVDFALIGAVLYRESRWRTWVWDGDCRRPDGSRISTDRGPAPEGSKCDATGPMQVSYHWARWARTHVPGLEKLERAELKTTTPNIRVSYYLLEKYKRECGGPPAVWMTAWRWGRCPTRLPNGERYIEPEAVVRCALARQLYVGLDGRASEWSCTKAPETAAQAEQTTSKKAG